MNCPMLMFISCYCIWKGQHRYIAILKEIRRNFFKLSQLPSKINAVVKTYRKRVQSTKLPCSCWKSCYLSSLFTYFLKTFQNLSHSSFKTCLLNDKFNLHGGCKSARVQRDRKMPVAAEKQSLSCISLSVSQFLILNSRVRRGNSLVTEPGPLHSMGLWASIN